MDWSKKDTVNVFAWGSGVKPAPDRMQIGCAPVASVPKNITSVARNTHMPSVAAWCC